MIANWLWRLAFRFFKPTTIIKYFKFFKMNRSAIKDILYGGLTGLMDNNKFYRFSPVGKDYCKWTDEGQAALMEYMQFICAEIAIVEAEELNKLAKKLVIDGLKGDKS